MYTHIHIYTHIHMLTCIYICRGVCVLSCVCLCNPMTVAHQALLSVGFPKQGYRSGLPFYPPGDLPNPGIAPSSFASVGGFFTTEPPGKPICMYM